MTYRHLISPVAIGTTTLRNRGVMGSMHLINQFLATRTNDRADRWGGTAENPRRDAGDRAGARTAAAL